MIHLKRSGNSGHLIRLMHLLGGVCLLRNSSLSREHCTADALVCPYAYTRRGTAPELRRVGFAQFVMHCELVDRNCLMDSEDSIIFELYHHFRTVSEGLFFQKRTVAISNCSLQNIEHMVSNCQLLRIAGTTL